MWGITHHISQLTSLLDLYVHNRLGRTPPSTEADELELLEHGAYLVASRLDLVAFSVLQR